MIIIMLGDNKPKRETFSSYPQHHQVNGNEPYKYSDGKFEPLPLPHNTYHQSQYDNTHGE